MDALQFLKATSAGRQPVYALVGDEPFLKRHARERIISTAIGDEDPEFAVGVYQGDKLDFSTARNDVESFPENTKLAKALPDAAKIVCKAPPSYKLHDLQPWLVGWARSAHKKKLAPDAAELLLDLVGSSMGLLDQELGKLAVAVGAKPEITADDVERMVGRSKAADVFRILDAIGDGKPGAALSIVEELFSEGEDPMAVMGPLTASLRKLATVGRLLGEKMALGPAMDAAGVPKWDKIRIGTERQIRRLGLNRLSKLT